jgi:hypothetical protein
MAWDIALALLAFASQFVTSYLGWRVTVDGVKPGRKKVYEAVFVLGGIVGAFSIGIATYRASGIASDLASLKAEQKQTNTEITKIEKNTEQHSHINFEIPSGRRGIPVPIPFLNPMGSFRKDDDTSLNVGYMNVGDYLVPRSFMGATIIVSPIAEHEGLFTRMRKTMSPPMVSSSALPPHTNGAAYFTFHGPKLTRKEAQKLNSGDDELCVLGLALWKDDTGAYETDCDICLSKAGGNFNWHLGPENNKEIKH